MSGARSALIALWPLLLHPAAAPQCRLITLGPFLAAGCLFSEISGFVLSPTVVIPRGPGQPLCVCFFLWLLFLHPCLWGFPESPLCLLSFNNLSESALPIPMTVTPL